MNKGIGMKR